MVKLRFGRDICNCLPVAEKREWLVTNGIGGFAAGTVAGLLTYNITRKFIIWPAIAG